MNPILFAFAVLGVLAGSASRLEAQAPLPLEAKIPLGEVKGRIDHLAVDPGRRRLFVAELENDSVGVVDIDQRKVMRVITGMKGPQGIAHEASTDTLYVANGGDGTVRIFQAADFASLGRIELGDDADNIRVDAAAKQIFIGYGSGALAVIDPASRSKIADIALSRQTIAVWNRNARAETCLRTRPDARNSQSPRLLTWGQVSRLRQNACEILRYLRRARSPQVRLRLA